MCERVRVFVSVREKEVEREGSKRKTHTNTQTYKGQGQMHHVQACLTLYSCTVVSTAVSFSAITLKTLCQPWCFKLIHGRSVRQVRYSSRGSSCQSIGDQLGYCVFRTAHSVYPARDHATSLVMISQTTHLVRHYAGLSVNAPGNVYANSRQSFQKSCVGRLPK